MEKAIEKKNNSLGIKNKEWRSKNSGIMEKAIENKNYSLGIEK